MNDFNPLIFVETCFYHSANGSYSILTGYSILCVCVCQLDQLFHCCSIFYILTNFLSASLISSMNTVPDQIRVRTHAQNYSMKWGPFSFYRSRNQFAKIASLAAKKQQAELGFKAKQNPCP